MSTADFVDPTAYVPVVADTGYEIVNGAVTELEPMGAYEQKVALLLANRLENWAVANQCGQAAIETLFRLSDSRSRRPDVAYISYDRWPRNRQIPRTNAWDIVPDLAVEVVSRTNTFDEIVDKTSEYFAHDVRGVWVVSPSVQQVHVYASPTEVRIVPATAMLTDEPLLPGFEVSLADVFNTQATEE